MHEGWRVPDAVRLKGHHIAGLISGIASLIAIFIYASIDSGRVSLGLLLILIALGAVTIPPSLWETTWLARRRYGPFKALTDEQINDL